MRSDVREIQSSFFDDFLCRISGGHGPDTFLLKIRSRENKMVEVQLAIYGTADWHSHRTKILAKIEEVKRDCCSEEMSMPLSVSGTTRPSR